LRKSLSSEWWIEVIGIDDTGVYHMTRIKRTADGDLYWFPRTGQSQHLLRHASGETHFAGEPQVSDSSRKAEPLDRIPFEQLVGFALAKDPRAAGYAQYRYEPADGVFAIDLRKIRRETFNVYIYLVNSPYVGTLFNGLSLVHQDLAHIHPFIFTAAEPWLLIVAHDPD